MALRRLVAALSHRAHARRAAIFRETFQIGASTRILDLGTGNGSQIARALDGFDHSPSNVYAADVLADSARSAATRYGFVPVIVEPDAPLPFDDNEFDLVYSSSVLEHATVLNPWTVRNGPDFRWRSWAHQQRFAAELRRVGRGYYVQTPNRWFPIESHTWLPLAGYLPRRALCRTIQLSNRYWIKSSIPDFNLLAASDLRELFPEAFLIRERFAGLTKSLIAIYRP